MLASLFIFFYFGIISPYFEIIQQNPVSLAHRPLIPTVLIIVMSAIAALSLKFRNKYWECLLVSCAMGIYALPQLRYWFWTKAPWISLGITFLIFIILLKVSQKFLYKVIRNSLSVILVVFTVYASFFHLHKIFPLPESSSAFVQPEGNGSTPDVYHFIIDSAAVRDTALIHKLFPNMTYYPEAVTEYGQTIYSLRSLFSGVNVKDEVADLKINHVAFDNTYLKQLEDRFKIVTNIQVVSHLPPSVSTFSFKGGTDHWYDFFNFIQAYEFLYFPFDRESYFLNVMPTVYKKEADFLKSFTVQGPTGGRYFLIHFISPHPPGYLNKSCELDTFLRRGSYDDQYSCILETLSSTLNKKEFDNAAVIIHGDHGHSDPTNDRHRPLLLIKKPNQKGFELVKKLVSIQDLPLMLNLDLKWRAADVPQFFYHNIGHKPERGMSRWEITPDAGLKLIELKLGTYPMDKFVP